MYWKYSATTWLCLLLGLSTASCTYESSILEQASCKDELPGSIRTHDGAICTDGWWIFDPNFIPDASNHDGIDAPTDDAGDFDTSNDTEITPALNVCGGTKELEHDQGEKCGLCNHGEFKCNATTKELECIDQTNTCPLTNITFEKKPDIVENSVTLHAIIKSLNPSDVPGEFGFCWKLKNSSTDSPVCVAVEVANSSESNTRFSHALANLQPGRIYDTSIYYIAPSQPHKQQADSSEFISFAPAPKEFNASTTKPNTVTLQWKKAEGATGYKVFRNTTHLAALDDALQDENTTTIDDDSAEKALLKFAQQPSPITTSDFDYVHLKGFPASINQDAKSYSYTIIALYPEAESAQSNPDDGKRSVGTFTYQWMRANSDTPYTFTPLPNATTLEYKDRTAAANGTLHNYYLAASAQGALSTSSDYISGSRKVLEEPKRVIATTDKPLLTVSWQSVPGADHYSVFRSDKQNPIAQNITDLHYIDLSASLPNATTINAQFHASKNEVKHVKLTWNDVGHLKGQEHVYWVVAHRTSSGMSSLASSTATGRRHFERLKYEIKKSTAPNWNPVVPNNAINNQYTYLDTHAASPTITESTIAADPLSTGAGGPLAIKVTNPPTKKNGAPAHYQLSAVFQSGPSSTDTFTLQDPNMQTGFRQLQGFSATWQHTNDQSEFENVTPQPIDPEIYILTSTTTETTYRIKYVADHVAPVYSNELTIPVQ